jgi:hypothetical protein
MEVPLKNDYAKLIATSHVRSLLLDGFYRHWEKRGGPDDYFLIQQVWDDIHPRYKGRLDGPLVEGAVNGLLTDGLLARPDNDQRPIAQITEKGRSLREERRGARRTKALATVGAITGTLSLVWNVVSKVLGLD